MMPIYNINDRVALYDVVDPELFITGRIGLLEPDNEEDIFWLYIISDRDIDNIHTAPNGLMYCDIVEDSSYRLRPFNN